MAVLVISLGDIVTRTRKGTNSLTFGVRLRKIMDDRRLTVRAVANMAGVTSSVIQSWISKAAPHDLAAVGRLAQALNVGFKELLLGEPEHHENLEASFEAEDFFEGICRIKVQKLSAKKRAKG